MMEPFRFVHAARLQIDHALHGVGPLPDSIRPIVEDATLLAWEQVIAVCLSESVGLLLLTGECAELVEQGLRGSAALVRGLERLCERGTTVVIAGGMTAHGESWPTGLRWPANVVRLDGGDEFAVQHDGRLLAIVRAMSGGKGKPVEESPWLIRLTEKEDPVFRIFVSQRDSEWSSVEERGDPPLPAASSDFEYHATGGGSSPRVIALGRRMVHDPGPVQAIRPSETGPRGCTLVRVDETGRWVQVFVPTAPVRFEALHLTVGPEQTRDDLLLEMIVALERLLRYPTDRVWLVALNVTGSGQCLEMLGDEREREAFLAAFYADHGFRDLQILVHAIRLYPAPGTSPEPEHGDDLAREFATRLTARAAHPQWALQRCLDESRLRGGPWSTPLRSLLAELDAGEIARDARRLGLEWFAAEEEHAP